MDIFTLLPAVIREYDAANGNVLRDVFSAIEEVSGDVADDISALTDLIDPTASPQEYLPYLSQLLGERLFAVWDLDRQRIFIRSLVHLYHSQGQQKAVAGLVRMLIDQQIDIVELYKSVPNETGGYSDTYHSTNFPHKSARIQFDPDVVDELDDDQLKVLRSFYPAHVREYRAVEDGESAVVGEDDLAFDAEDDTLYEALASFEEHHSLPPDGGTYVSEQDTSTACVYGLEINVVLACSITCETAEENTGPCTYFCELSCTTDCQYSCTGSCQGTCENACMMEAQRCP